MPRFNVEADGQWACYSGISDGFITPFMSRTDYENWREKEYGKECIPLDEANHMSLKDSLYSMSFNKTSTEIVKCLQEAGLIFNEQEDCDEQENGRKNSLCSESENFVQNKFGYCFYSLGPCHLIYNLYVLPEYRRRGHSKRLLELAISEIRKSGYCGKICIEADPREGSIGIKELTKYYKSMGLTVLQANDQTSNAIQQKAGASHV